MTADRKQSPDREQTDDSLRAERARTDQALTDRQAAVENDADQVVLHAREQADAVLVAARQKADQELEHGAPGPIPPAIAAGRLLEDDALRGERATADRSLRRERDETARALARLLPLERSTTDRYLLTERVRSDDAVLNRDTFLGIVSHDFRDLIGGIVMTAGLLAKRAPDSAEGHQTLAATERIQRYAARMNRLIGDLVDVASIDAGKLAVTAARGDSALLIAEIVDTFQGAAAAKGVALRAEIVERPLLAEFDHDRMLQVLANLITNSIKFTPQGGTISVLGERAGDAIRFCVSDTGSGIPADLLDAIFERFRQAADPDRRGLGLGLYISKCIVEAHGGRIWAESEIGAWSRVCFTVPSSTERRLRTERPTP